MCSKSIYDWNQDYGDGDGRKVIILCEMKQLSKITFILHQKQAIYKMESH